MLKKQSISKKSQVAWLCFYFCFLAYTLPTWADVERNGEKLKGQVEQSENNNDNKNKQSTGVMGRGIPGEGYLKGLVQEENISTTKEDPSAVQQDPDVQDKELMIEWDHWRNRFLRAVLSSTSEILNSDQAQNFQFNPQTNVIESKYPLGTVSWFACCITREGQIKDLCIEHSSGFANYDHAVQEAVQSLAGSALLKFPSRSKRVSVLQAGGVQRTTQSDTQYFHFGDTEHYRIPSY